MLRSFCLGNQIILKTESTQGVKSGHGIEAKGKQQ